MYIQHGQIQLQYVNELWIRLVTGVFLLEIQSMSFQFQSSITPCAADSATSWAAHVVSAERQWHHLMRNMLQRRPPPEIKKKLWDSNTLPSLNYLLPTIYPPLTICYSTIPFGSGARGCRILDATEFGAAFQHNRHPILKTCNTALDPNW